MATANKSDKQLVAFCLNFLELQLSFTFIGTESSLWTKVNYQSLWDGLLNNAISL